ncbi:MAG TPA: hypothetical protein PLA18_11985, partial [Deltaproteobacteria bacterium]|nr:hypothetical protein [Deltaproteobacteria bacterium]
LIKGQVCPEQGNAAGYKETEGISGKKLSLLNEEIDEKLPINLGRTLFAGLRKGLMICRRKRRSRATDARVRLDTAEYYRKKPYSSKNEAHESN